MFFYIIQIGPDTPSPIQSYFPLLKTDFCFHRKMQEKSYIQLGKFFTQPPLPSSRQAAILDISCCLVITEYRTSSYSQPAVNREREREKEDMVYLCFNRQILLRSEASTLCLLDRHKSQLFTSFFLGNFNLNVMKIFNALLRVFMQIHQNNITKFVNHCDAHLN